MWRDIIQFYEDSPSGPMYLMKVSGFPYSSDYHGEIEDFLAELVLHLLLNNHRKAGISAMELQSHLGIPYKSAWYLLLRIRTTITAAND
jgi:hypothetical protein